MVARKSSEWLSGVEGGGVGMEGDESSGRAKGIIVIPSGSMVHAETWSSEHVGIPAALSARYSFRDVVGYRSILDCEALMKINSRQYSLIMKQG